MLREGGGGERCSRMSGSTTVSMLSTMRLQALQASDASSRAFFFACFACAKLSVSLPSSAIVQMLMKRVLHRTKDFIVLCSVRSTEGFGPVR
jgi:hypothetical protein